MNKILALIAGLVILVTGGIAQACTPTPSPSPTITQSVSPSPTPTITTASATPTPSLTTSAVVPPKAAGVPGFTESHGTPTCGHVTFYFVNTGPFAVQVTLVDVPGDNAPFSPGTIINVPGHEVAGNPLIYPYTLTAFGHYFYSTPDTIVVRVGGAAIDTVSVVRDCPATVVAVKKVTPIPAELPNTGVGDIPAWLTWGTGLILLGGLMTAGAQVRRRTH